MDDNIVSHVEQEAIEGVINTIEGYFPGLVIERGNTLNFLGMEIEFKDNKKFGLSLVKYITKKNFLTPSRNPVRNYPTPQIHHLSLSSFGL